jgi:hypothetical protein
MSDHALAAVYLHQHVLKSLDIFFLAGALKILLMNVVFPPELYIICRPILQDMDLQQNHNIGSSGVLLN